MAGPSSIAAWEIKALLKFPFLVSRFRDRVENTSSTVPANVLSLIKGLSARH